MRCWAAPAPANLLRQDAQRVIERERVCQGTALPGRRRGREAEGGGLL